MKKKVNSYEPLGPLGSNDPVLPINVAHLHGRLNAESDGLSRSWKQSAVDRWFKTLDRGSDLYTPSRRSLACQSRTRSFGQKCKSCHSYRSKVLSILRPLRDEIKRMFDELFGIDYGMTIGIFFGKDSGIGTKWFDVVTIANSASFGLKHGSQSRFGIYYTDWIHGGFLVTCTINGNEVS